MVSSLGRDRKPYGDPRPGADRAPDVEHSAMPLDDMLDDGEAKAGAGGLAAAGGIDAVEALGHPRQMLARDPRAMVGDGKREPSAVARGRHFDARARLVAAVSNRVAEKIVDDLDQLRT